MTNEITVTITAGTMAEAIGEARVLGGMTPGAGPTGGTGPGPTGGTGPGPTGGTGPGPVDKNVYPLTMAPVATAGATVDLGVGPDLIQILVANYYGQVQPNVFAVIADGKVVAAPLSVTAVTAQDGGQIFNIRGVFGAVKKITFNPLPEGMLSPWINAISYNYQPYVYNGPATYTHGGPNVNARGCWDSVNLPIDFTPPIVVVPAKPGDPGYIPPPPPPATLSTITADINGAAHTGTLAELVAATPAAGVLTLPVGTFFGTAGVAAPCTIKGAGMGQTILSGVGVEPYHSKAGIVFLVPGCVVSDMTLSGWAIGGDIGGNATSARDDLPGIGGTLIRVESTKNQDGILTSGGSWTLTDCKFHDNGAGNAGSGATHEAYFADDANNIVTITGWTSTPGPYATHALKSRANTTNVSNTVLNSNNSDPTNGGNAGAICDVPNGGNATFDTVTFNLRAGSANTLFLAYAVDGNVNSATGRAVVLKNCVLADANGTGGGLTSFDATATLDVTGSTYTGATPPVLTGWASVTGTIAKAA